MLVKLHKLAEGLRERALWMRHWRRPGAVILLYHRVTKLDRDPMGFAVRPQNFREQLEVLWKDYCLLSLRQLTDAMLAGQVPEKAVALTFDDGYADNLIEARPLLEKYAVPATLFIATGGIERQTDFWWDELDEFLLGPFALHSALTLLIKHQRHSWDLSASNRRTVQAVGAWNLAEPACPSPRHRAFRELVQLLTPLREDEREVVLADLARWTGRGRVQRQTHRTLTAKQIAWLATSGLMEIGAHSVTHSLLAKQPAGRQREEIEDSRSALEAIVERPVTSFAYPYGGRHDYSPATLALLREAGFQRACAHFQGAVRPDTDRLQLPRMAVGDWDGDEFARRMRLWLPR